MSVSWINAPLMTMYKALWAYDDEPGGLPPGTPPTYKFEGPWFTTQLTLSTTIGVVSFLLFSYCRTRWPLVYAPRTKLKGFSPHEAHSNQSFFGWIIPTIRTSEFAVLQIVGLDAAVLLSFYKMSFWLFSTCSVFAVLILMPINLKNNIDIGDGSDDDGGWRNITALDPAPPPSSPSPSSPGSDWLDLISDANSYLSVHLLFTYLFTILSLYFIHKNYKRYIRARQLFSLELVHSVAARTVMITHLPPQLRAERALQDYFEHMGMQVESVSVCREVASLKRLLDKRTEALKKLEEAWVKYMGNPCVVDGRQLPQPQTQNGAPGTQADGAAVEAQAEIPGRRRPTLRLSWFKPSTDAIDHLQERFKEADEMVRKRRRSGKFKATHVAFVTFDKMSSAQIATQSVLAPSPSECLAHPAPEPRDIIWSAVSHSPTSLVVREWIVFAAMGLLLFFWLIPITGLASLLSYKEIKKTMPWLGELIDRNQQIRAIVQNSLPSVAMISLNATLPLLLEGLTYIQGFPARSWIEYSLMKKYFLFLLVNVVFIFLLASTYWQLVRDLASSPAKGVEKLADALAAGQARHFFLSYVILQGLGIMPLQILNLGVLVPRLLYRMFITRTPRDYAELNAPPMINYGAVYPQSILIFVITLLYSVIQPLILIFGAVYFGVAYLVYKYKLLFVFYKPYESQGQAWPITFVRLIWGVVIFNVFMTGIFILKKAYVCSSLIAPLLAGTLLWSWSTYKRYRPLSQFVNLSSIYEVERGEDSADVVRLRSVHPVSWSQSNLNRRRYAQNDEVLYVAPEDERTDYSQPPMANWYGGVLNTGKRRYGHPALNGILPTPWLPRKKQRDGDGTTVTRRDTRDSAVVLTLRKRYSKIHTNGTQSTPSGASASTPATTTSSPIVTQDTSGDAHANPWSDTGRTQAAGGAANPPLSHRLSFDYGSGVIALPEETTWGDHDSDSDDDVGELRH
ncbi:hypothetical protein CERSUDRAFT_108829 [Gelatoporia subvermispora B]|uniref:DUF221-domain-containing protein n=1 Tax=Ceriporiopsis subvermispora (strain B) TaxID=914234 RepID=M2QJW2_CERS8|nr:hypothetical protein CERSUDRAFT_108829 [Gelatoporia subvermispora B]